MDLATPRRSSSPRRFAVVRLPLLQPSLGRETASGCNSKQRIGLTPLPVAYPPPHPLLETMLQSPPLKINCCLLCRAHHFRNLSITCLLPFTKLRVASLPPPMSNTTLLPKPFITSFLPSQTSESMVWGFCVGFLVWGFSVGFFRLNKQWTNHEKYEQPWNFLWVFFHDTPSRPTSPSDKLLRRTDHQQCWYLCEKPMQTLINREAQPFCLHTIKTHESTFDALSKTESNPYPW